MTTATHPTTGQPQLRDRIALPDGDATPIRFHNLLRVELRKFVSTRSQRVLHIVSAAVLILIVAAMTIWYDPLFSPDNTGAPVWAPWVMPVFLQRFGLMFLVPTAVVLFVTSEWSTRSAMTTFTLVPRRGRIVLAKGFATAIVAILTHLLMMAGGLITTLVGRSVHGVPIDASAWVSASAVAKDACAWLIMMASAFGIALLAQSTPLALAIVLAGPVAVQTLRGITPGLDKVVQWIDLNGMSQAVLQGLDDQFLPQLLAAVTAWIVVPIIAGTIRTLRREAS